VLTVRITQTNSFRTFCQSRLALIRVGVSGFYGWLRNTINNYLRAPTFIVSNVTDVQIINTGRWARARCYVFPVTRSRAGNAPGAATAAPIIESVDEWTIA
jgi:hypothetical protein